MSLHALILCIICILIVVYLSMADCPKHNIPTYHIVVSKYKEDPTWLFHMNWKNLHVYDKSGDKYTPFVPLENKGREGATFLGHIVKHYDNLPDYLVLVQGNPFPHMDEEITPDNFQNNITRLIQEKPIQTQPLFCKNYEEPILSYPNLMVDQYYQLLFEGKPKDRLFFSAGNQYVIPRKDIQRRPKVFYQKLLKMSIKGDHFENHEAHYNKKIFNPNEIIGWTLERLFSTIMSNVPTNKKFIESK